MIKRNSSNLVLLLCSTTLTFYSGNSFSQNIAIEPPTDDCVPSDAVNTDDAASMATRLSCYNLKLDNLTNVLSGLISERAQLNNVIGDTNTSTQRQISADSEVVDEQQKTIQKLQLERAELRAQLHRLLTERHPLQLDQETDERLFKNYSEAYTSLTIENDELRKLLTEYQATATTHQATAKALQSTTEQQSKEITSLNSEITTLKSTIADLSTRKKKLTSSLEKSDSRIELMKKQLLANTALIQLQRDNVTSLQQAQAESTAEREAAELSFAKTKDRNAETVGNLIATKEKLYTRINTLTTDLTQLKKQSRQASLNSTATLGARDKEISALSKELKTLNTARENLENQLTTAEQDLQATTTTFEGELNTLTETNNALSSINSELTLALRTRETEIQTLEGKVQDGIERYTEASQKAESLRSELASATDQVSELTQANSSASASNAELDQQLQTRLGQINALQIERDRLAAELNEARPEITKLSANLSSRVEETTALKRTVSSLESDVTQSNSTVANLTEKLDVSTKENAAAGEQIKSLTASVTTLESILEESLNSNKHIEESLAAFKADLSASQTRLNSKQAQLQELMAEKAALIDAHNALAEESENLAARIEKNLIDSGADSVTITRLEDNSLVLKVDSSQLFRTGSSRLSLEGQSLLSKVGSAIESINNRRIMIEGHSDNVPLGAKLSAIFKDNLGLSMARALSTANFFTENAGIKANKMSVSGAGDTKPLANNDSEEGRQKNRRVEILLLPAADDQLASVK